MFKNPIVSLFLPALVLFASCGGSGTSDDSAEEGAGSEVQLAGAKTYLEVPDATEWKDDWSKENTVVYHVIGEPDDMHPTNGNSAMRTEINNYTQKQVIGTDLIHLKGGRPELVMAMPEISANELEFTYELRDEPTWDDGSQISMADILFTFKANKCPLTNNPHAKPYLENLEDIIVDAENPRKFTIKMKKKYIQNIVFLTDYPVLQESLLDPNMTLRKYTFAQFDNPSFDASSKADLSAWATEFNDPKYSRDIKFFSGIGAYEWTDWKPGQSYTLTRKENHWTSKLAEPSEYETAYPEKIIFKINTDPNSQSLEFKSQALDASTYLPTKKLLELQQDPNFQANYHSHFTSTYNYSYLAMNCRPDGIEHKKLFTDKRVRRAVAMLTPVDMMNEVLNSGKNERMIGPVSPLKREYNDKLDLIQLDIEGAIALLEEAGWVDTDNNNIRDKEVDGERLQLEFDLHYMTTQVTWKDMAQMISESLYEAGIKANLVPLDFAVLYDRAKNHKFDAMLAAWAGSSVPSDFTQIWHTSTWASKGSNFTGFGNANSDALIDSIKYTLDFDTRAVMVKELQSMIYDEQPYVFLYASNRRAVIHKRFGNAYMTYERPGVIINNFRLLEELWSGNKESAQAE